MNYTTWLKEPLRWEVAKEQSTDTRTKVKKFHPPQRKPVGAPALGENEKFQRALERMRKSRTEWEDKRNSRQTQIVRR